MNNTTAVAPVNLADEMAAQTRNAERAFIAVSWLDPVAGNNAGADAGLTGEHFAFPEHAALYGFTSRCAEVGTTPDIRQCVAAMRAAGLPLSCSDRVAEAELYDLVMSSRRSDGTAQQLAEDVVRLARKRKQAGRLIRRVKDVLASDVIDGILQRCRIANTQSYSEPKTFGSNRLNGYGPVEFRGTKSRSSLASPV